MNPSLAQYRLTITAGAGLVGAVYPLSPDKDNLIGRSAHGLLSLPSSRVAPIHCRIVREDHDWVLRSEQTGNGRHCIVIVNDGRCKDIPLAVGDHIEVGGYRLRFDDSGGLRPSSGAAPPPAASAPGITLTAEPGPPLIDDRMSALAGEAILIGHSDTALWQLPDRTVSRHHCRVQDENGRWTVRDLQSRNGTYQNGKRVTRSPLQDGDRLTIGRYSIRVAIG